MLSIYDGLLDLARDMAHEYDLMTATCPIRPPSSIDTALPTAHRSVLRALPRYLASHLTLWRNLSTVRRSGSDHARLRPGLSDRLELRG